MSTKGRAEFDDPKVISINSSNEFSYSLKTRADYEFKWGTFDIRYVRRAIGMVRELVNFDSIFRRKFMRCTDAELLVLENLEACVSDPNAYWKPHQRPYISGTCRPSKPGLKETWICTWFERDQAQREGRTIEYKKAYYRTGDLEPLQVTYGGALATKDDEDGPAPRDALDAINAFFDYAQTEDFADEHGELDEFEFWTLREVRRATQYWLDDWQRYLEQRRALAGRRSTRRATCGRKDLRAMLNTAIQERTRHAFAVVI